MRKFNVRWWRDDPDWERQRYEQMIVEWNEKNHSACVRTATRVEGDHRFVPTGFYEVADYEASYQDTFWALLRNFRFNGGSRNISWSWALVSNPYFDDGPTHPGMNI